jgi:hypothetical protein
MKEPKPYWARKDSVNTHLGLQIDCVVARDVPGNRSNASIPTSEEGITRCKDLKSFCCHVLSETIKVVIAVASEPSDLCL